MVTALVTGLVVGISIASMQNMGKVGEFNLQTANLPTQVFDIKGRLITEFFQDEKRELIKIEELPPHLVHALITREDQEFYEHQGFSFRGYFRAGWNLLSGSYVSGGSTLTQQLATSIYLDKSDISIIRKLKEFWYSIQIENHWSKNEILEEYLNKMSFGHNTNGVEAASQFFFGRSAREISVAESALLVLQVSSPNGKYSPLKNPQTARVQQKNILNQMVSLGYASKEDAEQSFDEYWNEFDYTRSATETAFFNRKDEAPYFSEYIRGLLESELLLGEANIYRDGYKVYTTLDLDNQRAAEDQLVPAIAETNALYQKNIRSRTSYGEENFVPLIDLLSLSLNIDTFRVAGKQQRSNAKANYRDEINPLLDLLSVQFAYTSTKSVRRVVDGGYADKANTIKSSTVEGALISIENGTGHILAMVGGSQFESRNQFNRATQARVQPGSAFKPLYYAAGIESEVITPSTMIYDTQVIFIDDDGVQYRPLNYRGEWKGPVMVRNALAQSMNVPSLRILSRVGFDNAIQVSSRLLGIPQDQWARRSFERKFPLALGVVSVSPIEMAQAFATFPNLGREVVPVAIRYIENRHGVVISEPEKQVQDYQLRKGSAVQLISPATAYIMTDMLQSTLSDGTLLYAKNLVGGFTMPMAGKTGTPQNWSAAWTVGYSPYMTTAVWLGIDSGGNNSLGTNQTGSRTAGPIWARYMKEAHKNLEPRQFARPNSGISYAKVTLNNGLLPLPDYKGLVRTEIFRTGTEPKEFDDAIPQTADMAQTLIRSFETSINSLSIFNTDSLFDTSLDVDEALLEAGRTWQENGNKPIDPSIGNGTSTSTSLDPSGRRTNTVLDN